LEFPFLRRIDGGEGSRFLVSRQFFSVRCTFVRENRAQIRDWSAGRGAGGAALRLRAMHRISTPSVRRLPRRAGGKDRYSALRVVKFAKRARVRL
jgi:hypothetical protein